MWSIEKDSTNTLACSVCVAQGMMHLGVSDTKLKPNCIILHVLSFHNLSVKTTNNMFFWYFKTSISFFIWLDIMVWLLEIFRFRFSF